jgi:hypothetical protein
MEETRNAYGILAGKHLGKRPLGRPRRWEDNINMNVWNVGCEGRGCIKQVQDGLSALQKRPGPPGFKF